MDVTEGPDDKSANVSKGPAFCFARLKSWNRLNSELELATMSWMTARNSWLTPSTDSSDVAISEGAERNQAERAGLDFIGESSPLPDDRSEWSPWKSAEATSYGASSPLRPRKWQPCSPYLCSPSCGSLSSQGNPRYPLPLPEHSPSTAYRKSSIIKPEYITARQTAPTPVKGGRVHHKLIRGVSWFQRRESDDLMSDKFTAPESPHGNRTLWARNATTAGVAE